MGYLCGCLLSSWCVWRVTAWAVSGELLLYHLSSSFLLGRYKSEVSILGSKWRKGERSFITQNRDSHLIFQFIILYHLHLCFVTMCPEPPWFNLFTGNKAISFCWAGGGWCRYPTGTPTALGKGRRWGNPTISSSRSQMFLQSQLYL